jgi:uracil-DNA glycosylase family 4
MADPTKSNPARSTKKKSTRKKSSFWLPPEAIVMKKRKTRKKISLGPVTDTTALKTLAEVQALLKGCERCPLYQGRTNIVFGEGNPKPELVFIGEGPGRNEDESGRPFVGRGGQLLEKMIEAMGPNGKKLERSMVYIANVVKCRPPDNRAPFPEEAEQCMTFLEAQLRILNPKVVVTLGKTATQTLLKTDQPLSELRGKWVKMGSYLLVPSYHPAYLLRNPPAKKEAWEDLKVAKRLLGW